MRESALCLGLSILTFHASAAEVRFNHDIRPLMSDTCFHCHGPDAKSRKADLRLDIRDAALRPAKSGEIPIVPGKPDESEIIRRLFTTDQDDLMPPPEAHKTFTAAQKETFKRWVAEGAKYEDHWAYTPLVQPKVPVLAVTTDAPPHPVDAFVREKQLEKGMTPSPEADKSRLLRRLSLDLTGLPPKAEENAAFLADTAPGAYEKQVDRLLQSPHFGERMAVWWLDVVRYADTAGYHGDQIMRVYPYRDYVIDAFNANKPFDQFTREQLAGDLLPNPGPEQLTATCFNRLNLMTREGGAQPKEYLAKYAADRVRTVAGAWLGSTFGCAECHDHKFDPISQKDFYALQSFFADIQQWGVYADYGYTPEPEIRGMNNDSPFLPEAQVENVALKRRSEKFRSEMQKIVAEAAAKDGGTIPAWRAEAAAYFKQHPDGWITPDPAVTSALVPVKKGVKPAKVKVPVTRAFRVGPLLPSHAPLVTAVSAGISNALNSEPLPTVEEDGSIVFQSGKPTKNVITFTVAGGRVTALRLELLPREQHKGSILRNGSQGNAMIKMSATLRRGKDSKPAPLPLRLSEADLKTPRYAMGEDVLGISAGWQTSAAQWNQPHHGYFLLEQPFDAKEGDEIDVTILENPAGCIRISTSAFAAPRLADSDWMRQLAQSVAAPQPVSIEVENEAWFFNTSSGKPTLASWQQVQRSWLECRDGKTWVMVAKARPQPLPIRVLPRGNWQDESGELVPPTTPHFLPVSLPQGAPQPQRLTRLDLANWLCSKENPLTARTIMNRLWKQFYGNALSNVVDDLGAQGEPPSHPELLDWLSAEFRDHHWDVKRMVKLMVTSANYRQSSSLRKEYQEIDPQNRLLSSQNPRRLDAEFIRDNALAIADLLNLEIGGPSAKPYQPPGYYANLQFPDRDYVASPGADQWRRGVYMHWQRTFLHPMLANFDAPMRDECAASRTSSNTPQQALTLLNDPAYVEAARVFAQRLLALPTTSAHDRLQQAFRWALNRDITSKEAESLAMFLNTQREQFIADKPAADKLVKVGFAPAATGLDPLELATWTSACRVILNLHETVTRY